MHESAFHRAGLTSAVLAEIDHLVVGCGGFARELLRYTSGASTVKGASRERLSAADTRVDRLLRSELTALVPGSCGYSEEGGHFGTPSDDAQVHWLIDPIDGTRPALMGGAYAVSVCGLVIDAGEPQGAVGWVYVPPLQCLYRGIYRGEFREALLNGEALAPPAVPPPDEWPHRFLAVDSDGLMAAPRSRVPWKLTAPGASAVHLTQLIHPDTDVLAVRLSRYRPYDVAAGLVITGALGLGIYDVESDGLTAPVCHDLLPFLFAGDRAPNTRGPRMLVAGEAVAATFV